jgi:pimeloyl-ACP methyl ester carboxylesterase
MNCSPKLLLALLVGAAAVVVPGAVPAQAGGRTLAWAACDGGFQCATIGVPLDYDQPHGRQVTLAMIRLPATDPAHRVGTLFVNFGGPGGSGVDLLRQRSGWTWLFSPELKARFDLVSWDTRGVNHSTAARCFPTEAEQVTFFTRQPAFPVGAAEERTYYTDAAELGRRCQARAGDLLDHLSTANTARDMDLMRHAVGDHQLSYLGLSYGTYVGATYANLYPSKVRAMVLDGALDFIGNATGHGNDGSRLPIDTRQDVPRGAAETFQQFLARCDAAATPRCAFAGGAADKFARLTATARQHPVRLDGQDWTYASIVGTVNGNLARPTGWATLAILLQRLYDTANGTPLRPAARAPHAEPYDNGAEAFYATNCADSDVPHNPAIYSQLATSEERRVPYFGPIGVFDYMPCAFWPTHDTDRYNGPWNQWTAAPILVVNNRYDPFTPLHGAQDATAELARAQLFTVDGAGHTGMYVPSTCGERIKRDYLITTTLPPAGVTCAADNDPFPPT